MNETLQIEVSDFDEANEFYHAKGWTDGLPIIPPTPVKVARFLDAAGLQADSRIGYYNERQIPVYAEKLAINTVMAGCLPEYFPVVVAIIEAMLEHDFPTHVVNTSTGSFTIGFIVNGPIRHSLGMNFNGNMLGPGNRANSSIGRAVRLIQMNALASIAGAGGEPHAHGRPKLDRSMMGQPAKYAGYHIIENEEAFPSLLPVHVERGFAALDSTITLMFVAGYKWICAHSDGTPDEWIDTMAHYVVGGGFMQPVETGGCATILLPPENADLFVRRGWSKADIREALFERTRRSAAWIKREGYKVQMQRGRLEDVEEGDEQEFMAISGSASPDNLFIVPCGGPAGSWPYYLYGGMTAITRKIRTSA